MLLEFGYVSCQPLSREKPWILSFSRRYMRMQHVRQYEHVSRSVSACTGVRAKIGRRMTKPIPSLKPSNLRQRPRTLGQNSFRIKRK